jgi:hypothetical protein
MSYLVLLESICQCLDAYPLIGSPEPTLGLRLDVHPVLNPLPVEDRRGAHVGVPGRHAVDCLAQALDLGALLGDADFGDGPDIRLQVDPFLLAAEDEPSVILNARGVP